MRSFSLKFTTREIYHVQKVSRYHRNKYTLVRIINKFGKQKLGMFVIEVSNCLLSCELSGKCSVVWRRYPGNIPVSSWQCENDCFDLEPERPQ